MAGKFYEQLRLLLDKGEQFSIVTVVKTAGSVPRKAGTKMIVSSKGDMIGTIGGGCPEAEASIEATETARQGCNKLCHINMNAKPSDLDSYSDETVLICGGYQDVLLEAVSVERPNGRLLVSVLDKVKSGHNPIALISVWKNSVDKSDINQRCGYMLDATEVHRFAYWGNEKLETVEENISEDLNRTVLAVAKETEESGKAVLKQFIEGDETWQIYVEPFIKPLRLVIAGAGHIAVPLCRLASMCGYIVTVVDDRKEFATKERFPEAVEIKAVDFRDFFRNLHIDRFTSIVIITRGHRCDEMVLHSIIGCKAQYLGMIGSRHRIAIVRDRLKELGATQEWIDSLHAPIGLNIGGETPAEIAVSIVAQMIANRTSHLEISRMSR